MDEGNHAVLIGVECTYDEDSYRRNGGARSARTTPDDAITDPPSESSLGWSRDMCRPKLLINPDNGYPSARPAAGNSRSNSSAHHIIVVNPTRQRIA